MKKSILSALVVLGLAGSVAYVQAAPSANEAAFAAADAVFATRDVGADAGLVNTLAARAAYQAIVNHGAKDADLVRAVTGVARTYYYQGEVILGKTTDTEKKARKALFNDCWSKAVEQMSPAKTGTQEPAYYYFRATCMAHEAEVSSTLENLLALPKLLATFTDGFKAPGADTFEGGGLGRVQAAVRGNVAAKGLPGGLFNPTAALTLIDTSINSQGEPLGALFCENYYRKAITLALIPSRTPEAKALTAQTITDFTGYLADGTLLPESIRAETKHCVAEAQAQAFGASL
ncbi:MAG: hypothetical protein H7249_10985 [Chitinophagaceae bacterium]|nr:hypothetical protein [Oligoflexus sp.]